jgi:hypothetical protein
VRSQQERDEQTLDIMMVVLGAVLVFLLLAALVWVGHVAGFEAEPGAGALLPALAVVYFAVVAIHLRRRRRP